MTNVTSSANLVRLISVATFIVGILAGAYALTNDETVAGMVVIGSAVIVASVLYMLASWALAWQERMT